MALTDHEQESPIAPALLSLLAATRYVPDTSVETWRTWLRQGRFQKVKIGRRVFIRRAEIDEHIRRQVEAGE